MLRIFVYCGYAATDGAALSAGIAAMARSVPTHPRPTAEEAAAARESGRALAACLQAGAGTPQVSIVADGGQAQAVPVPAPALKALVQVLAEIGAGNAVSVMPIHAELTTQEAADLLNVSRPFLVQLLERGEIPYHKVGSHRRVRHQDVIAWKEQVDAERGKALDALVEQGQALRMGYE
jgi:excisionase family DNA binding protein